LEWKILVHFMGTWKSLPHIWYILWLLSNTVVTGYIFPPFWSIVPRNIWPIAPRKIWQPCVSQWRAENVEWGRVIFFLRRRAQIDSVQISGDQLRRSPKCRMEVFFPEIEFEGGGQTRCRFFH
jgi:hypothetical protein